MSVRQLREEVEALHDLCGQGIELVRCRRLAGIAPQLVPARNKPLDLPNDRFLIVVTRSRRRDRQVLAQGFRQLLDPVVYRDPFALRRVRAADQLLVHLGEIEIGRAVEIERHQRTIVKLDDEAAGRFEHVETVAPEQRDQQAHADECAGDRSADRGSQTHPHRAQGFLLLQNGDKPAALSLSQSCKEFNGALAKIA